MSSFQHGHKKSVRWSDCSREFLFPEFLSESPNELYQEISSLKPTKETHKWVKEELKNCCEGKLKLPPLKLAPCYYFNRNLSYGPGLLGWMSSVYANERSCKRFLERVGNFNLKNIRNDIAEGERGKEKGTQGCSEICQTFRDRKRIQNEPL